MNTPDNYTGRSLLLCINGKEVAEGKFKGVPSRIHFWGSGYWPLTELSPTHF